MGQLLLSYQIIFRPDQLKTYFDNMDLTYDLVKSPVYVSPTVRADPGFLKRKSGTLSLQKIEGACAPCKSTPRRGTQLWFR